MQKIKVVVLLVRQLQHGFTKNAKVSPNLTVTHLQKSSEVIIPVLEHGKYTLAVVALPCSAL